MVKIKMYMKPGCWLCDMAQDLLNGLTAKYPLEVRHVDVSEDPELYELYRFDIPVLEFADGQTVNGHVKKKDLVRLIEANMGKGDADTQ